MAEFGLYGQWGPWGLAAGWDTENGPTGSAFQSLVAGPSADAWVSYSSGKGFEGVSLNAGIGVPIEIPTPVSANLRKNVITGDTFATFGINTTGFSDFGQIGIYLEGEIEVPFQNIEYMSLVWAQAMN